MSWTSDVGVESKEQFTSGLAELIMLLDMTLEASSGSVHNRLQLTLKLLSPVICASGEPMDCKGKMLISLFWWYHDQQRKSIAAQNITKKKETYKLGFHSCVISRNRRSCTFTLTNHTFFTGMISIWLLKMIQSYHGTVLHTRKWNYASRAKDCFYKNLNKKTLPKITWTKSFTVVYNNVEIWLTRYKM